MKVVFFSILSSTPAFLSRPVYQINNSPKILVNFTKFSTEKHASLQLALNLNKKEKVICLICWKWFSYIVWKIRKKIFLLFYVKDLLTTGKNPWKTANSTTKVSTSNLLQVALLARYGRKAGSHWNKKSLRGVLNSVKDLWRSLFALIVNGF